MAGISTLGQVLRQIENLTTQQQQIADLSTQLATGKKTQTYAGLGTDALTSVRSRVSISSIDIYINNIQRAETTIGLELTALEEFQAQSQQFSGTLTGFLQEGSHQLGEQVLYDDPATPEIEEIVVGNTSAELDADFEAVIAHAGNLSDFMTDLLNTKEGDRFVFAGADSQQQPIDDTGTLDAAVSTLLTDWKNGTITTDELIADLQDGTALDGNPNAITDSTIGYSPSLSSDNAGGVFVRASDNSELEYTALANEDNLRNIVVALAVIKNENFTPIVDVYEDGTYPGTPDVQGAPGTTASEQQENFYELYNALAKMVVDGVDGIDSTRFGIESTRAQMEETKQSHISQQQLLINTVSDVENVDVNEVAVKLSALQVQLQTSYQVTAATQNLTLANFL
ncbi:MAG: flagellin [Alphaproteobacteria bacterium]